MIVVSFIGSIYYNMIIAWALYYIFASFSKILPWDGCEHDYNTQYCYEWQKAKECNQTSNGTWINPVADLHERTTYLNPNVSCYTKDMYAQYDDTEIREKCNETANVCWNETYNPFEQELSDIVDKRIYSSEEYFNIYLLDRSDAIEDWGYMKWDVTLVFFLSWIIVFLCVIKGIKSSGKVVYFTALFPYIVLIILLIRGLTLEGAVEGIKFYIIPEFDKLNNAKVWADAAGQIFFSLSVGYGGLMTYASYNKFNNNIYRDVLVVSIGNCLTSFFAGFAIFSILGHMAYKLGVDVKDVASSGSGLAFVVYPEVFTLLPPPQLWSIIFFVMLLTLGLDSQFAGIENCVTGFVDIYPKLRPRKTLLTFVVCSFMFITGLSQCTRAGIYWFELIAYYSSGWSLVIMGAAEGMVIPWVYGATRLTDDIEQMVGFRLWKHWWVCWTIITPLILIVITIMSFIEFVPLTYGDYVFPYWAQVLGWLMAFCSVVFIPIFAAVVIVQSYKDPDNKDLSCLQIMKKTVNPTPLWEPEMGRKQALKASHDIPKGQFDNPAFEKDIINTRL